ncbi:MAG: hypothetical protein GTN53_42465, partial [Candidatus Aminicenantes bacterium]|nr:hypothetical protein [Candidatus Aminicenantes bacterium]NIQ73155.1 hypothetical protein [Candidatus Aminicenantes bacterium]NIT29180.1 hypothetical protein [Candidatus Aminicenantes bacterium]
QPVQRVHDEVEFAINCYRYHTPAGMDMEKEVQGEDRLNLELQCIKQALVKQFDL